MRNSFGRIIAIGMALCTTLSHAAVLYTFSNLNAASPYNFSLLETGILNSTGAFAIPPFQINSLTYTQATLTAASGTECFQFGTAGASLSATPSSCGVSAFSPDGGMQSLFLGANAPGTYAAFNAISNGSAPAAPTLLTIQYVSALLYTFSSAGQNPYSFSILEPGILNATGAFAIPPIQINNLTFTQATLTAASGTECFQFGTAGASLSATPSSCGVSAFSPDGGMQSLFLGANAPGTYVAFNAVSDGNAPAAPEQLTIASLPGSTNSALPEPESLALLGVGLLVLALFRRLRVAHQGLR